MIIRVKHNKENLYVQIFKGSIEDPELSLKGKGLLAYLLTKPDDWQIYIKQLARQLKESKNTVGRVLNELIDNGYCTRRRNCDPKTGRFKGFDYDVFEVKQGTVSQE